MGSRVWFVGGSRSGVRGGCSFVRWLLALLDGDFVTGDAEGADAIWTETAARMGKFGQVFLSGKRRPKNIVASSRVRYIAIADKESRLPARQRLAIRTRKAVESANAGAVLLVSNPHSIGSLNAGAIAAQREMSVIFAAVGFDIAELQPLPGCVGSWSEPFVLGGLPCVRWYNSKKLL